MSTLGIEPWRRHEVADVEQHDGLAADRRDRHQPVHRLGPVAGMASLARVHLLHADDPPPVRRHDPVRVAQAARQIRLGRDRGRDRSPGSTRQMRWSSSLTKNTVSPASHHAPPPYSWTATRGREPGGEHVGAGAVGTAPHDLGATALARTPLVPPQGLGLVRDHADVEVAEPDGRLEDPFDRDRGTPGAVRCGDRHGRRSARVGDEVGDAADALDQVVVAEGEARAGRSPGAPNASPGTKATLASLEDEVGELERCSTAVRPPIARPSRPVEVREA